MVINSSKKIFSAILSLVLAISMCTGAFAANNVNKDSKELKKAEIVKKLEAFAQKNGAKIEIVDNVDTPLKYDSFEEFEKALEEFDAQFKAPVTTSDAVRTSSVNAGTNKICSYDHGVMLDNIYALGTIRQKVVVDVNPTNFGAIKSHTSYIYGASFSGWTWTVDISTEGTLDSSRTLWAKDNGHVTLTASIGGFGVNYTFDRTLYHEWGVSAAY
ncbi:hypothetical protein [Ruminiclostridium cellobioparum]|uniref:hypothetical protein n=1 Tax=Ruminiclostridium cellobioparum TaxID=29355 RepID=UPI0028A89016|nr:hypothetical protein [Ruminiclostridium cellobioparum]